MSGEPCAWLYNSAQVLLENKESSGQIDNFEMTYHLNAGEKYYVAVGCSELGRYTFKIKSATAISSIMYDEMLTTTQMKTANISFSGEKQIFSFTVATGGYTGLNLLQTEPLIRRDGFIIQKVNY